MGRGFYWAQHTGMQLLQLQAYTSGLFFIISDYTPPILAAVSNVCIFPSEKERNACHRPIGPIWESLKWAPIPSLKWAPAHCSHWAGGGGDLD